MSKLKVSMREIGSVRVFDLQGSPTQESLQEVAWKIQRNIRRYRVQRVILNLQMVPTLEALGIRKLLAACIRPQRNLIFGASSSVVQILESSYLPRNVRICESEKEVAEDLGPFLIENDQDKKFQVEGSDPANPPIGTVLERRRSKRMHVALPIELTIHLNGETQLTSRAIATNISEGGLFAAYLDLDFSKKLDTEELKDHKVEIRIFPSDNFPEEYCVDGLIRRKAVCKKQLGLGVEFLQPEAM